MADQPPPLTPKQRRFVEEFAGDTGNATAAYFRAFGRYTSKGVRRSYKGAQASASALLSNPIIKAEVDAAADEYRRRTRTNKVRVIRETAAIAFADAGDVFEEDPFTGLPTPKKWGDVPVAARRAIASVKVKRRKLTNKRKGDETVEEIEEVEYKFWPKTAALDALCKKLGLYAEGGAAPPAAGAVVEVPSNGRSGDAPA